jgi:hypothetical protein
VVVEEADIGRLTLFCRAIVAELRSVEAELPDGDRASARCAEALRSIAELSAVGRVDPIFGLMVTDQGDWDRIARQARLALALSAARARLEGR